MNNYPKKFVRDTWNFVCSNPLRFTLSMVWLGLALPMAWVALYQFEGLILDGFFCCLHSQILPQPANFTIPLLGNIQSMRYDNPYMATYVLAFLVATWIGAVKAHRNTGK